MQYKIVRTEYQEEPIEHALFGKGGAQKGSTWANHKYIARQKTANSWRYFYTQAELAAAKAGQAGKNAANKASGAVKSGVAKTKKVLSGQYAKDVDAKSRRLASATKREIYEAKKANGDTDLNSSRFYTYSSNPKVQRHVDNMYKYSGEQSKVSDEKRSAAYKISSDVNKAKESINEIKKYANKVDEKNKELEKEMMNTNLERHLNNLKLADEKAHQKYREEEVSRTATKQHDEQREYNEQKKLDSEAPWYLMPLSKLILAREYKDTVKATNAWATALSQSAYGKEEIERLEQNGEELTNKLVGLYKEKVKNNSNPVKYGASKALNVIDKAKDEASKLGNRARLAAEEGATKFVNAAEKAKDETERAIKSVGRRIDNAKNYASNVDKEVEREEAAMVRAGNQKKYDEAEQHQKNAEEAENKKSSAAYKISKTVDNAKSAVAYKQLENKADKAGRDADKLGQKTDKLSDEAEKALQQYGRNSEQYKKAYDDLTEAFANLEKKEAELANYERQLEAYEKNKK